MPKLKRLIINFKWMVKLSPLESDLQSMINQSSTPVLRQIPALCLFALKAVKQIGWMVLGRAAVLSVLLALL